MAFDFAPLLGGLGLLFGGNSQSQQIKANVQNNKLNNSTRLADAFAQIKQRSDEAGIREGADSRDASINPLQKELESLLNVFLRGR